jgi:hypothetical protein
MNGAAFVSAAYRLHMVVTNGLSSPVPWKSAWARTAHCDVDFRDVAREFDFLPFSERTVVRQAGILLALGQLIANACRFERLQMIRTASKGDKEGLATGAQIVHTVPHELQTNHHLLQRCCDDRHVQLRL